MKDFVRRYLDKRLAHPSRPRKTILQRASDLIDADAETRKRKWEPSAIERFLGIDENTKINWFGDE